MPSVKDILLGNKAVVRQIVTAILSLVFCSGILLYLCLSYFEKQELAALEQIATIVGENGRASLTGSQQQVHLNYLESLPDIEQVVLLNPLKEQKAQYVKAGLEKYIFVPPISKETSNFTRKNGKINFFLKIFDKEKIKALGTVCIRSNLGQAHRLSDQFLKLAGLILLLGLLAAVLLSMLLNKLAGRPYFSLAALLEERVENSSLQEIPLQDDEDSNRIISAINELLQQTNEAGGDEELLADLERKIAMLEAEIERTSQQLSIREQVGQDSTNEAMEEEPTRPEEKDQPKAPGSSTSSGISNFEAEKIALEMDYTRKLAELQSLLKKREAELERHRKECEEFTLSAAEDLKEPIRSIRGFGKMLQSKYSDSMEEQAQLYVNYINGGAQQMEYLIEDLQTYFKIRPLREAEYHKVDLRDLLMKIEENLATNLERTGTLITKDEELPIVKGDRMHLGVLFQNLISNAIKYRSENREPEIHIGVKEESNEWIFSVIDNGIGISEREGKDIFKLFHKINPKSPGTGFGLPICKKIVEINGGNIWFESEPGFGTTFYFSIEKN